MTSVSVGLPTYNRAESLDRAIASVLAQSFSDLELVISDNASTDGTEALCRAWAQRDDRVRYLREPVNRGPTANFNRVYAECRAPYVMVLGDDDWIDADYVERCRAELEARPDHALVCGLARYLRAGELVHEGTELRLDHERAQDRVRAYFAGVRDNGMFYGLMRRSCLSAAAPLPEVLGGDWTFVARVLYLGKARTLRTTHVQRELGGTSAGIDTILAAIGRRSTAARIPHLVMAAHVLDDVGRASPVYAPLGRVGRARLALCSALAVIDWASLAWHLTAPTARALGRRPRGRWVWTLYDRLTRALGAGRGP